MAGRVRGTGAAALASAGAASFGLWHRLFRHPLPKTRGSIAVKGLESQVTISRDRFAFRCDSDVAQLAAIRAGLGIGFCQAGLAARDPGMVRVLKSTFTLTLDTWIAMHADLRDSPRCATTFAALASGLKAYIQGG